MTGVASFNLDRFYVFIRELDHKSLGPCQGRHQQQKKDNSNINNDQKVVSLCFSTQIYLSLKIEVEGVIYLLKIYR